MDGKELFSKKELKQVTNTEPKRDNIRDRATAWHRDEVIKAFGQKWQERYKIPFILPPNSWAYIQVPIDQALKQGYTKDMVIKGAEAYIKANDDWLVENSHPIATFVKFIPKWVSKSNTMTIKTQEKAVQQEKQDNLKELNEKYGIYRKGETYYTEDGKAFVDAVSAVKWAERSKTGK